MSDAGPLTAINIISTAFSGTTWLGLMLGTHPEMFSAGEMKAVRYEQDRGKCALHGRDCPVWAGFDWNASENPFHQLARLSGHRTFVIHNSRKLLPHQRAAGARIKFIHLIRDGRAVTASMLRKRWKNRITSMWRAARQWRYDVRRNHRLLKRQPAADQIMVRYEDLIADRHAELSRICDFLGMQYDPTMIEFWNGDHHPAGGNAGTMFSMAREKESAGEAARADQIAHRVDPQRLDVNYYEEQDPGQFRDERWKNELSDRDLRIFGLIAGRLNRQFGYPPSLERRDTASVPVGV